MQVMSIWKSAKYVVVIIIITGLVALYVLSLTNQRFYEMSLNLKSNALDITSSLFEKGFDIFSPKPRFKDAGLLRILLENNCTDNFTRKHLMTMSLDGRTGNRLFELAMLIATAASLCYTPVIDIKEVEHFEDTFDIFNVKRIELDAISFRELSEPAAGIYDVNLTSRINPAYNWTLLGYRQSFKYFDNYGKLIRSSFRIKKKFRNHVLRYLTSSYNAQETVGLHVRRGDFVKEDSRKFGFSVSTIGYINRAIAYMRNRLSKSRCAFIVVSDDINWCKANINGDDIYYSPFDEAGRDLYLLTQCKHNIVTSGSFGWMGAWLNESGIVVYDKSYPPPDTPFGKMVIKDDYYPKHWIGL